MPSQSVLQQYGSFAQTSPAHVLHVAVRCVPVEQTACEHVPPPLLEPELELLDELPLDEPLELPLDEPLLLLELLELPLLEPLELEPELELEELLLLEPELEPLELPLELDELLELELLLDPPEMAAPFGVPQPVGPS
jgi:hypothetical protein